MKTLDSIPTNKIERAGKLVTTGIKVGGNYLRYYGEKVANKESAKETLNQNNAKDIYNSLKQLRGSALKVAQMLSMEKNLLPQAYVEQFSLSQFSVPPLSPPLVKKMVRQYLGADPSVIFDTFATQSVNAASIGQVHKATKNGKKLAVKIQYPGVANSIGSDLALVKPVAVKMFNLKGKETDKYFKEVEEKLLEETDYLHEIDNSQFISEKCAVIPNLIFPKYYKEWSTDKILTMDWMDGVHFPQYAPETQEERNKLGQTLWDFYMYQMHVIKKVQADPHPGNFMVAENGDLIAIDFGCIKTMPDDFYTPYFELSKVENIENPEAFSRLLYELEILLPTDTKEEITFFTGLFKRMMRLFTKPFHTDTFDFSDEAFWEDISNLAKDFSDEQQLRKMNGNRGSKHFIYVNRTFFGLYHLLHDLKSSVVTYNYIQFV